jgi:hypothetical protein
MTGLARIERRAWLSYHEDGLIDLAFGLLLIFAFAGSVADRYRYAAYVLLLLVGPALAFAKRKITVPRLGAVEFSPERKTRKRHVVLVIAGLVGGTAGLILALGNHEWLRAHPSVVAALFTLMVFLAFAAVAHWMDLTRMYVVGLLFGSAFGLTELADTPLPLLAAGTIVAMSGGFRLIRFLRSHAPAAVEDATDAG